MPIASPSAPHAATFRPGRALARRRRLARSAPLRVACEDDGQRVAGSIGNERLETPSMRVDDFDFELPENRIALKPASPRDAARLLHVEGEANGDFTVADLPRLLKAGDLLVLNDTKVIPAQLSGRRAARGGDGDISIDVTLMKRLAGDPDIGARWSAFVRPGKRVKAGDILHFSAQFRAQVEERRGPEAILRFNFNGAAFDRLLQETGSPPLPPYIARKRHVTPDDVAAYQTVYAKEAGSVAAPTAGLHFTPQLFERLQAAGIRTETITLHVGAGTFLPVAAEDTKDHVMHAEWGEITREQALRINAAKASGGRIIAVGTTSLRLLETAADENGVVRPFADETSIFITPGYRFKVVDALMTNFHLPRSTLFMLVCAFSGTERMKRAYRTAVDRHYRFYSYGDACLLERERASDG